MLISPAYAQAAAGGSGGTSTIFKMGAIFLIFYFLLIRPQQKQRKVHREMLNNVRRGDEVITGGGIIGKVTKVNSETEVTVEIAEDVRVTVARGTITAVINKQDAPAAAAENKAANKNEKPTAEKPAGLLGSIFGGKK